MVVTLLHTTTKAASPTLHADASNSPVMLQGIGIYHANDDVSWGACFRGGWGNYNISYVQEFFSWVQSQRMNFVYFQMNAYWTLNDSGYQSKITDVINTAYNYNVYVVFQFDALSNSPGHEVGHPYLGSSPMSVADFNSACVVLADLCAAKDNAMMEIWNEPSYSGTSSYNAYFSGLATTLSTIRGSSSYTGIIYVMGSTALTDGQFYGGDGQFDSSNDNMEWAINHPTLFDGTYGSVATDVHSYYSYLHIYGGFPDGLDNLTAYWMTSCRVAEAQNDNIPVAIHEMGIDTNDSNVSGEQAAMDNALNLCNSTGICWSVWEVMLGSNFNLITGFGPPPAWNTSGVIVEARVGSGSSAPVSFSDGFENVFVPWTGTETLTGSIVTNTTQPHTINYDAYVNMTGAGEGRYAYCYKDLGALYPTPLCLRVYFYWNSGGPSNGDVEGMKFCNMYGTNAGGSHLYGQFILPLVYRTGSSYYWGVRRYSGGSWATATGSSTTSGSYHCVEVDATATGYTLYVDTVNVLSESSLTLANPVGVEVGDSWSGATSTYTYYVDDVAVGTTYIGSISGSGGGGGGGTGSGGTGSNIGIKIDEMDISHLDIPNDTGLATNIIIDLISGSGVVPGNIVWNDTPITVSYTAKKVFDAVKEISDIIGTDFYVDIYGKLQMFNRQTLYISGSEIVLRTGSNVVKFSRSQDLTSIKNYVDVLGAAESNYPFDSDTITEKDTSVSGYYVTSGSVIPYFDDTIPAKVGNRFLLCSTQDLVSHWMIFQAPVPALPIIIDTSNTNLTFYANGDTPWSDPNSTNEIRLLADPNDNKSFFSARMKSIGSSTNWNLNSYALGSNNITGSGHSGDWNRIGNIQWQDIKWIQFFAWYTDTGGDSAPLLRIDGLHFDLVRWTGSAIDLTSSGSYGYRYYREVSDYLHSNEECQFRAMEILSGSNYPINQLTITITGSENINPGHSIFVDIPSEGIVSQYFDILEVSHIFDPKNGYLTELQLSDQKYIRDVSELKNYGIQRWWDLRNVDMSLRGIQVIH